MNGWTIVQTFINPPDAYMAKAFLESSGIETLLQDELTVQTGYYSNAIGGVKLLVPDESCEQAIRVLEEGGYIVYSEHQRPEDWVWVDKKTDRDHCPFCHSDNIGKCKNLNTLSVIVFFLIGIFFPLFRSVWKCQDCGKAWKYN